MTESTHCAHHESVSVIICTAGNRPSRLERCLESLVDQKCSRAELLVVLNKPLDLGLSRRLCRFPIRLLNEPRPGVCVARNLAIPQADGEILMFTDDDVIVHPNWIHKMLEGFEDPEVACVTGRVVPEGIVQISPDRMERYYFSDRARSSWTLCPEQPDCVTRVLSEPAGFGCNMAFRSSFLNALGAFPEDLGAGTPIGGDEFYMFIQVLKRGFRLRHNGQAVVTHFFGEDRLGKSAILGGYASGAAFTTKLLIEEKGVRVQVVKWLIEATFRRAFYRLKSGKSPSNFNPAPTRFEKLRACMLGVSTYWKLRRASKMRNG